MADRIQFRRDTAARWAEFNPILLEGEIGYILDDMTHYKMGDGVNSWNNLPLRGNNVNIAQSLGNDENSVISQKVVTEQINNLNKKIDEFEPVIPDTPTTGGVTGVKGNAELEYRQGDVNITPADIGLGNVSNTADSEKTVKHSSTSDIAGKATNDSEGNNITQTYAKKESINEISQLAQTAESKSSEALTKSESAIQNAAIAKNAVATLEGLANTTTAQETLAAQVVQIEENKQNIGIINVNISDYTERACSIGNDIWYLSGSGQGKHIAIPVDSSFSKLKITCGSQGAYIAFLPSYSVPSANDAITYCEEEPYRIWQYENITTEYNIPKSCSYIAITTQDGVGLNTIFESIQLYKENGLANNQEELSLYDFINVNIDDIDTEDCSLGNNWYLSPTTGAGKHKAIPIKGYKKVKVNAIGGNEGGWIGFVTEHNPPYQNGDAIPFSYRYRTRIWQWENKPTVYDVPSDATHLIVSVEDGAGNLPTFEVTLYSSSKLNVQNTIENITKSASVYKPYTVDFQSLPEQDCSLGKGYWYIQGEKGRHKAIPVNGARKISIDIGGIQGTYLGFLTNKYNPPYILQDPVPFCSSTPERIWQYNNVVEVYDIPKDCAYVVVSTVDGAGLPISYNNISLYGTPKGELDSIQNIADEVYTMKFKEKLDAPITRLRMMVWNIGHYCNGTGISTAINNTNYEEKKKQYRELFNSIGADVVGLVEYSDIFNSDTNESASTAIIPQYKNQYFGDITNHGYQCNGIVTNLKVSKLWSTTLETNNGSYIYEGEITYLGNHFMVAIIHLPFYTEDINIQTAETIIKHFENTDKVIIMGDFNIFGTYLYDKFAAAGYDMANHGYLGDIITRPETGTFLDNIMIKGGKILHTEVPMTDLSDHLPVVADIVI